MSEQKKEFDILEFATKASKFIETNFKAFLIVFAIAVIGGSAWSYKLSMDRAQEQKAFNDLFAVTKTYQEKKNNFQQAKDDQAQKNKDKSKSENSKAELPTGDLQKDYGDEVAKLEAFLDSHKGRNAAGEAALLLSEVYAEYNMPEKGSIALEKALKNWGDKNVLYFVMQMRTGDLFASSNNCEKATSYWQVVANSESFIATQAQLKLGVCLQELGRLDEAKTWFEKIKAKSPNSTEGFSAKRYLRYLEFKTNNTLDAEQSGAKAQSQSKAKDTRS